MFDAVIRSLEEEIRVRVKGLWELDLESVPLSQPPKVELGDLATPVASTPPVGWPVH